MLIDEQPITTIIDRDELRALPLLVPQKPYLFSGTVALTCVLLTRMPPMSSSGRQF